MMHNEELIDKLNRDETAIGTWVNMGSSLSAEIVGRCGFDWVLIDLEHGSGTESNIISQLQALKGGSALPFVRVESAAAPRAQRVLDMGAAGVMFPQIKSVQEAEDALSTMYYPPMGRRGLAKMTRCNGFAADPDGYLKTANESCLGVIQIEHKDILPHLDEVAALPGADILFIGPADLSLSLGIPGEYDNPVFETALAQTVEAARKHRKHAGILIMNTDMFEKYRAMGFRFIAAGSDMSYVRGGALSTLESLKRQLS